MAQIAPFRGIAYNPNTVPLSEVIAPPYDVLSPEQQNALYAKHPLNFVRIMLNKEEPADDDTTNRYTRAAGFLQNWLAEGSMIQDETPAFYEYIQQFEHPLVPEKIVERRTLFVALKLEPYENGIVLPHEETHPKAKADRLHLMRATHANPEPIYGLYADPTLTIAKSLDAARANTEPFLKATFATNTAPDAEQHLIYRHTDPCLLSDIEEFFGLRRVWIADGHHRYETALNYKNEQPASETPQPSDYLLIGLSAFEDPGLVVLPTHRLIKNLSAARLEDLPLQLERYFTLEVATIQDARTWIKEKVAAQTRFALLLKDKAYKLILRDIALMNTVSEGHCEAWKRLDVSILQMLVLDRSLGISWTDLAHTPSVAYTRDENEAVQKVQNGDCQIACLLQNPAVNEVRDVASAGDKMPQKSTFFYPKLWSGLILRSLRNDLNRPNPSP